MKVLVVSATKSEIAPFMQSCEFQAGKIGVLSSGQLDNISIDILVTGVGMLNTTYYLGNTLSVNYDYIINAGIAGAINRELSLGEVVHVFQDQLFNFGANDNGKFLSLGAIGLDKMVVGMDDQARIVSQQFETIGISFVRGVTVNEVHGSTRDVQYLAENYEADVESMEGAGFMMACELAGQRSIQIRAISNYVEPRNKAAWNIPLAIENLNRALPLIIKSLA